MILPIGDDNRELARTPIITYGLILANVAVFVLLQQFNANDAFDYGWSVVPREIVTGTDLVAPETVEVGGERIQIPQAPGPVPIYLTILVAMFMHGGLLHLIGNLLYLWIFGDNVENRFGRLPFLGFYLATGIAATAVQIALDPQSIVPNLGASGAISGVLGAYMVLFPRNRVRVLVFYFLVSIPAVIVIGFWIFFQFINGYGAAMMTEETVGGVAYGAHVGGFAAGIILAFLMRGRGRTKKAPVQSSKWIPSKGQESRWGRR